MGKYKNTAYGCWEMWKWTLAHHRPVNWEEIGKKNGVDAKTAENLAKGWDEVETVDSEPNWIG